MNMRTFCHTCHPQSWCWSCHCIPIFYSHCPQIILNLICWYYEHGNICHFGITVVLIDISATTYLCISLFRCLLSGRSYREGVILEVWWRDIEWMTAKLHRRDELWKYSHWKDRAVILKCVLKYQIWGYELNSWMLSPVASCYEYKVF
jgi:hypothetical protein